MVHAVGQVLCRVEQFCAAQVCSLVRDTSRHAIYYAFTSFLLTPHLPPPTSLCFFAAEGKSTRGTKVSNSALVVELLGGGKDHSPLPGRQVPGAGKADSKIKDWNWGGYALKNLFQAVKKFKADVLRRNPTVHIVGCHLFLQLFVLDSLELGVLNRARGVTPRIGLYDYESIKNMVEKITVNSAPGEVSFHGAPVRSELSVRNLSVCRPKEVCATNTPKPTTAPKKANATCTPIPRNSYAKTDAQEFSNYIRTRYPSISTEKLGVLLREQNARGLANISEMRQAFQSNMFTFTDKLMICIADSCTCCKAHGSKRCILKREDTNTDNVPPMASVDQTQFSTPLVSKIGPRLPAPGNHEGTVSANSPVSWKRDGSLSSSVQSGTSKKTYSRDQQAIVALTPTYSQSPHNQNPISQDRTIMEIASNIVAFTEKGFPPALYTKQPTEPSNDRCWGGNSTVTPKRKERENTRETNADNGGSTKKRRSLVAAAPTGDLPPDSEPPKHRYQSTPPRRNATKTTLLPRVSPAGTPSAPPPLSKLLPFLPTPKAAKGGTTNTRTAGHHHQVAGPPPAEPHHRRTPTTERNHHSRRQPEAGPQPPPTPPAALAACRAEPAAAARRVPPRSRPRRTTPRRRAARRRAAAPRARAAPAREGGTRVAPNARRRKSRAPPPPAPVRRARPCPLAAAREEGGGETGGGGIWAPAPAASRVAARAGGGRGVCLGKVSLSCDHIVAFYDDLTAILVTYYAEIRPTPAFVLFGSTTDGVPLKIDLPQCNFGRDPWVAGSVPAPPIPTVLRAIRDWMTGASMLNLERKWIVHPKPRLISLDGVEIHRQLVLNDPMTHEMATAIFHRLGQIDMLFSKDTPRHIWRKFVEPDFATTILANADPLTVQSIRTSFQEGTSSCNPASCRMWYISAILPDSWTVYAFDMLRKRIIVLDPAVGPFGYSNRRVSMHEFVSNKLHAALFNCLEKFFSSWHC
ncbi:hypothetical protein VPH35_051335 [Triticum aestivum]